MQDTEIKDRLLRWSERLEKGLSRWLGRYITIQADKPLSLRRIGQEVGRGLLCSAIAYLLTQGQSIGGTRPFGLALLCAAGRRGGYLFGGLLLSSLTGRSDMMYGVAALLCFLLRLLVGRLLSGRREPLYREALPLRMAIGAAGGFTVGLYGIFAGGFAKERLWEAIFLILVIPALVFLLGGVTEERELSRNRRQAGRLTLVYAVILSLRSFSLFGLFSPALMAAFFLTVTLATTGGPAAGCLTGVVAGLAGGLIYSPMLALCGWAAGLLKGRGPFLPLLGAIGLGNLFSICFEGFSGLVTTLPALLWAGILYLPAARFGLLTRLPLLGTETPLPEQEIMAAVIGRQRETQSRARLAALSEAMSSLSGVFYALSHRFATPGTYAVRELCEDCLKAQCHNCRRNGLCWGQEYDRTADTLNKLAASIAKDGSADSSAFPADFSERCPHTARILSDIRLRHARLLEEAAQRNKAEVFAIDYEALADLLAGATAESNEDFVQDEEITRRARRAAVEMGMMWNSLAVFGTRRKTLVAGGVETAGLKLSANVLCRRFSQACGMRLTVPTFHIDNRYVTMTATSAPIIACESARASLRKENEQVNGDSAVVFENREGYFYALLSDGMGSGTDAAITSRITCIFLEKLLSAGNKKGTVLKMLNHVIRHKNVECFATVDLLEVDLLTGEGVFVKSGAAASYLLREGKLFKLASSSLPIGITREISAEELRFSLLPKDLIVMISDGVSQSFEDGIWLLEHLSDEIDPEDSLSIIARHILDIAKEKNPRSDDMTVELVRISEAPPAA